MNTDYINYLNQTSTSIASGVSETTAKEDNLSFFIKDTPLIIDLSYDLQGDSPSILIKNSISETFHELLNKWKEETLFISDTEEILSNENFIKLILLGDEIIPLVLLELKKQPSTLVWIMRFLKTNEFKNNDLSIIEACNQWLEWGKKNQYC